MALKAVDSDRVCWNSSCCNGVGSMYQPNPLPSVSISMVPSIGLPWSTLREVSLRSSTNLVIKADASCPDGRSVTLMVISMGVVLGRRLFQMVWALRIELSY